ncbi:MAG TPA: helicase C-terminal domain-containing protein [Halioglobus sp.]
MSYVVAVRALCEFTAKTGDLDLRFTPSPSAQEGIAGHRIVTSRRGEHYQAEIALGGKYEELTVRGRADGFDTADRRLEEIKTYRGKLEAIPDHHRLLHWAQAKIYGWLLCEQAGFPGLTVAVVYFNVDSEQETIFPEYFSTDQLRCFFESQCAIFLAWARQELAHRSSRDKALAALKFPHPVFREGQRNLAEAVYKSVCTGRNLLAQAPTGIGKTLATLFPTLKAAGAKQLDNIFFLTAKTTGRALALQALDSMQPNTERFLRVLELTARDKMCEHPDKVCHGDSCPLAAGFYDRLPAARTAAIRRGKLDQTVLRAVAAEHAICPYYLGQEMARWSDVIIGDYNYFFDTSALLFGLVQASEWRTTILVDEAHSLVERARTMYTAELDQSDFLSLRQTAPAEIRKALDRLHHHWRALVAEQDCDYRVHTELPHALLLALQNAVAAMTVFCTENPTGVDTALQMFYFNALHFCRLIESFESHSLFDSSRYQQKGRHRLRLCVRNVVPAGFLKPRFEAAHACILFSATLGPWTFYQRLLGLPEETAWVDVVAPFSSDQLAIHIADISTRFQHRNDSIAPIADLIAQQFRRRPGNYLAFFSSFDYLEQVAGLLQRRFGDIDIWIQERRMDEQQRTAFINRFTPTSQGIGFAVLGGVFAEGIDLPGHRLIGAFVATLGLPQVNPVNEQMMRRTSEIFGARCAYDYTYLIPGIRKVVQAGGRIVRTAEDEGTLYLIDDRFRELRVRQMLPKWWELPQNRGVG